MLKLQIVWKSQCSHARSMLEGSKHEAIAEEEASEESRMLTENDSGRCQLKIL